MQEWEYLELSVYPDNIFYYANGVERKYDPGQNRYSILNSFGAQGWEMVAAQQFRGGRNEWRIYEFRRPRGK